MPKFMVYTTFAGERTYIVEADSADDAYKNYTKGALHSENEDYESIDFIEVEGEYDDEEYIDPLDDDEDDE